MIGKSTNTFTWGGQPVNTKAFNETQQNRGGGIPEAFIAPYTDAVNRVARAQLDIPADIADSLLANLYPGGIINAGQDADLFASYFNDSTHAWMIDLLIDASFDWVQARYEMRGFVQTRLLIPDRWPDRIYPQVMESVRRVYRRNANLMLVCESVGSFYGLHALVQDKTREPNLLGNLSNQHLFTQQVNGMADALAQVYRRLRRQGLLA